LLSIIASVEIEIEGLVLVLLLLTLTEVLILVDTFVNFFPSSSVYNTYLCRNTLTLIGLKCIDIDIGADLTSGSGFKWIKFISLAFLQSLSFLHVACHRITHQSSSIDRLACDLCFVCLPVIPVIDGKIFEVQVRDSKFLLGWEIEDSNSKWPQGIRK